MKPVPTCLFCRIERGDSPAHVVLETEYALAFLDTRPLFPGHCLLMPRGHVETLMDVPSDDVGELFRTAQRLARAVEAAMEADGVFVAINNRISQSVPHLHVHVVPRRKSDGLRGFFWPRQHYESEDAMKSVVKAIQAHLG